MYQLNNAERNYGNTPSRLYHDGAVVIPGTCDGENYIERLKTGKYSAICEKLTIQKVIHDDFSSTGRCNFYLMEQHLLTISFGMIFQVLY